MHIPKKARSGLKFIHKKCKTGQHMLFWFTLGIRLEWNITKYINIFNVKRGTKRAFSIDSSSAVFCNVRQANITQQSST